ncbi:hypothetical protein GUJ93_ZPchr0004g39572 [Zizania palustris]|uniref:Leucine-rich repeat-containing N-terminal plant-type domain-containing protein n=1 Tax=Zizania palustris TaxID=103762 RepID=A0A8J5VFY9_ZIZPA|nr:hypothetical protein GUJ93_ZPchr0004g39572 [Zizania palustris]
MFFPFPATSSARLRLPPQSASPASRRPPAASARLSGLPSPPPASSSLPSPRASASKARASTDGVAACVAALNFEEPPGTGAREDGYDYGKGNFVEHACQYWRGCGGSYVLSAQIPATPGNDPSDELLIMDMSNNSLTASSLPSSLGGGLKGLLKMDISNNLLQGSFPLELAGLGSLTWLDLRNNSFTGGLQLFLHGMASLQDLLLSNNPLGGSLELGNDFDELVSKTN